MRLCVEPSESFPETVEIEVDEVDSLETLLGAVGERLSATVTELFSFDEDFGEFALVEKLADVTVRAQVTVLAAAAAVEPAPPPPVDPARAKRAAKLGLPEDASDADIAAAKAKAKRAKLTAALGLPADASEEELAKAKLGGGGAPPPKPAAAPASELSELPPAAEAPRPAQSVRQVTLTGQEVVVGATRDYIEYTFDVTGTDAGDETFTSRFSHAKSVHDQLFEEGALDRFADAGLSFPSHSLDALRDMTHDEENVKRRGEELEAYYTELFQKHGVAIGHKAFLPNFRRAMEMAKAKDNQEQEQGQEREQEQTSAAASSAASSGGTAAAPAAAPAAAAAAPAAAKKKASKPRSGEIKVGARSVKEVDVSLKPGERLCWAFSLKDKSKDVLLSVRIDSKEGTGGGGGGGGGDGWSEVDQLIPSAKFFSTDGLLLGDYLFEPEQQGQQGMERLTFIWDNRYSKLTAKAIGYHMMILPPDTQIPSTEILTAGGAGGDGQSITREEFAARGGGGASAAAQAQEEADSGGGGGGGVGRLSFRGSSSGGGGGTPAPAPAPTAGGGGPGGGGGGPSPRMGRRASILQRASSAKAMAAAAISELSTGQIVWDAPPDLIKQGELNAQWRSDILPHWSRDRDSKPTRALIAAGTPAEIRPIMWRAAVGNKLGVTRSDYIAALDKAKQAAAAAAAAAAAEVADDNSDGSAAAGGVVSEHDVAVVGGEFGVSGSVEQKELLQVIQAYTAGWSSSGSSSGGGGYCQGLPFVGATLLRHTAAFPQLAGFSRDGLENLPFSQLAKIAAAEGVGATELQAAMRAGTEPQQQPEGADAAAAGGGGGDGGGTTAGAGTGGVGKRELLLGMLTDLLPPEPEPSTEAEAEAEGGGGGGGGGGGEGPQRDTYHAFVLLANIIDKRSGRVLLSLMEMEPAAMAVLFDFFNAIFAAELPMLYEHFESIGMIPQLYLIEWLYTLFAKPLPQCVTAWIWDHIFAYGDRFIFQSALGLLKILEQHLLLQDDMMAMSQLLKAIPMARQQFEGGVYPPEAYESGAMWQGYYKAVLHVQIKDKLWEKFVQDMLGEGGGGDDDGDGGGDAAPDAEGEGGGGAD